MEYAPISASRLRRAERGIWEGGYWEHTIRNDREFATRFDYIHYNPVKHGYVARAKDWPWSSFHRYVKAGVYPSDWGGEGVGGMELEEE